MTARGVAHRDVNKGLIKRNAPHAVYKEVHLYLNDPKAIGFFQCLREMKAMAEDFTR